MFVEDGHHMALVQSFSKNFGLYGQRVGALSFVTSDAEEVSQLNERTMQNASVPGIIIYTHMTCTRMALTPTQPCSPSA